MLSKADPIKTIHFLYFLLPVSVSCIHKTSALMEEYIGEIQEYYKYFLYRLWTRRHNFIHALELKDGKLSF